MTPSAGLPAIEGPDGRATYRYDAFHRRMSKKTNGISNTYLYQGQSEIGAITNGKIKQLRILGKGIANEIGGAISFELGKEIYIPLYDSSGNVATLLTLDGAPVQTYRYSAFGELHESIGNIENPWRFSSKRFDPETGFYEFGRRYYFPEIGRWTTPDPAGFEDGENLYAYVHNSPLIHIDPDGRFAFLIPIAINIALSMAAEYALPTAIATLEQYYGGAVAASLLSGVVKGYNGSYSGNFSHDASLGLCEKAGMAIGTVLSYSPSKITANTAKKIAASELSGRAVNFAASKGARAVEWFSKSTARESAKKIVKTSAQKTAEVAARKGVVNTASKRGVGKNVFPKNSKDLLPNLPRDAKGYIYPADNIRIRPERHTLKPGQTYNSRHHGLHYHIESRRNPTGSWNRSNNVRKIKPEDYTVGSGTGFLPGELFPGA